VDLHSHSKDARHGGETEQRLPSRDRLSLPTSGRVGPGAWLGSMHDPSSSRWWCRARRVVSSIERGERRVAALLHLGDGMKTPV